MKKPSLQKKISDLQEWLQMNQPSHPEFTEKKRQLNNAIQQLKQHDINEAFPASIASY